MHRHEIMVPNTTVSLKSFDISYVLTNPDGNENQISEKGVKTDRLRIQATALGGDFKLPDTFKDSQLPVVVEAPQIVETTGNSIPLFG